MLKWSDHSLLKDVVHFDDGPGGSSWQSPYWSISRNYFGGSNEFHTFQILIIVPDLKNLECSVITQMERSKATSPAVQVKLRPCAGYMFLIMEVENWHSKTTFVWSQKERIALCIFNHTLTTKSNLTPKKIDAWVEFGLKYHHFSWCPSLLISGHQPQRHLLSFARFGRTG